MAERPVALPSSYWERTLLQNLSQRARLCYESAAEARQHAEAAGDSETKTHFLRTEKRWLLLARSNDFSEPLRAMPTPIRRHPFDPDSILEASDAIIFAKDRESRMMFANHACLSLIGKNWSELGGRNEIEWHSDRFQARQIVSNDKLVIESGQAHVYEELFDTPLGSRVCLSTKAPLLNDEGQIVGTVGISKDITERRKREEYAEFLRDELAHRLKNTISLVQAMARQSIDPGDGLSSFEGRLSAYARSQDLIYARGGATLHTLVYAHLHSYPAADKLHVDGPDIVLPASFAVEIGIALHELVTNSIKYGALGGEGRVEVRWNVETSDDRTYLVLVWSEQLAQLRTYNPRQGFGYKVLTKAVPHNLSGVASFEITSGEVRWTLRAELPTAP